MKPLQVWLPRLGGGLLDAQARRDMHRAFDEWQGEGIVWLTPDLSAASRELYEDIPVRAMPAEQLEWIDIYHITSDARVWRPRQKDIFPAGSIDGLLEAWLNIRPDSLTFCRAPEQVSIHLPVLHDGVLTVEPVALTFVPLGAMPIVKVDESNRTVRLRWPPEPGRPATVSPDSESESVYGPWERVQLNDALVWLGRGGMRSWHVNLEWPSPIASLVPLSAGADCLLAQAQMREIAAKSGCDPEAALFQAREKASDLISDGHTTQRDAWYLPALRAGPDRALFEAEDHGFKARTLKELIENPAFQDHLAARVPVPRAWGPLGLLWALLLDRLEDERTFRTCRECHRILGGGRKKQYCGPKENYSCFASRRAKDKRRSRERQRKQPV